MESRVEYTEKLLIGAILRLLRTLDMVTIWNAEPMKKEKVRASILGRQLLHVVKEISSYGGKVSTR